MDLNPVLYLTPGHAEYHQASQNGSAKTYFVHDGEVEQSDTMVTEIISEHKAFMYENFMIQKINIILELDSYGYSTEDPTSHHSICNIGIHGWIMEASAQSY